MFTRGLLSSFRNPGLSVLRIQVAKLQYFPPPKTYDDVEVPPDTRGKKLPIMFKVPIYPPGVKPYRLQKKLRLMRGPEDIHTELMHKQYGVIAMMGGRMKHGHFEMVRWTTNKKLPKDAFALWRIDGPWQPVTKKTHGMQMGGGKASINHYVTPLKAGRVIIEVGGPIEWEDVKKPLQEIAHKLPFEAMAVNYDMLMEMRAEQQRIDELNENPYTFKYIIQNNLGGCHQWICPNDKFWFGAHR